MKKWIYLLMAVMIALLCSGCGGIRSPEAIEGSRIGVLENSSSELYASLHGTVKAYASAGELVSALKSGSIDCILADSRQLKTITKGHPFLTELDQPLAESYFRIAAAADNPALAEQLNRAIAALTENGTLESIVKGHFKDAGYVYDCRLPEDDDRCVTVAVNTGLGIYCYLDSDGNPAGIDVDVMRAICSWLDITCEFYPVTGEELIPTVKNGACQLAIGGITSSADSADACLMTDYYSSSLQKVIVR
ncbi:MAG: transporter substrate-binding domain-containing protein [Oscillospiraceae bacterium]|nr:transporter substrate-binding domain-containing protein [Oscillospiraceae bacterium]